MANSYINAVNEDAFGKLEYDLDTANSVWKDSLGSMASAGVTSFVTGGLNAVTATDGLGEKLNSKLFDMKNIQKFNTVAAKVAGGLTEYAINGETTFNILTAVDLGLIDLGEQTLKTESDMRFASLFKDNLLSNFTEKTDVGLFELKFGKENGIRGKAFSQSGTILGVKEISAAMQGMHDQTKIVGAKTAAIFGNKKDITTLNVVNGMSYLEDNYSRALAGEIWSDKLKVKYSDLGTDENGNIIRGSYHHGDNFISVTDAFLGNTKEDVSNICPRRHPLQRQSIRRNCPYAGEYNIFADGRIVQNKI